MQLANIKLLHNLIRFLMKKIKEFNEKFIQSEEMEELAIEKVNILKSMRRSLLKDTLKLICLGLEDQTLPQTLTLLLLMRLS